MRYLGVDFGLKRIGLAISEGSIAAPLEVIQVKNKQDAINKISQVVEREGIDEVVLGLPESGIRSEVLSIVTKFKVPVHLMEETLTTFDAKKEMLKLGIGKKKRRMEDAYAACIMLQNYLDME